MIIWCRPCGERFTSEADYDDHDCIAHEQVHLVRPPDPPTDDELWPRR